MKQEEIFLGTEGDAWHERNKDTIPAVDPVVDALKRLSITPRQTLEIGCSNGRRLRAIQKEFESAVCGIDPSAKALADWRPKARDSYRVLGTAVSLPGGNARYDLVIFGFCLYVCDREDLFKIVAESDRVLKNKGILIIHDFFSEAPHSRAYSHNPDLRTYKMDHARLWLANPSYTLLDSRIFGSASDSPIDANDQYVISVLKKDTKAAFPLQA